MSLQYRCGAAGVRYRRPGAGRGYSPALLSHHARSGRFLRERRGLYRLREYPSSPREEVTAAWLAARPEHAVVSHESALDLLDLSEIIPNVIHLTVPRSRRGLEAPPGILLHTTASAWTDGSSSPSRAPVRATSSQTGRRSFTR